MIKKQFTEICKASQRKWGFFLLLCAAECALAAYWLYSIDKDAKNALLFGMSLPRLLIFALISLSFIVSAFAAYSLFRPCRFSGKMIKFLQDPAIHKRLRSAGLISFFNAAIFYWVFRFLLPESIPAYLARLEPLIFLIITLSLQLLIFLRFITAGDKDERVFDIRSLLPSLSIFIGIQLAVYLLIRISGLGISPDPFDWQPTGMAVQLWQLTGAFLFAALICVLISHLPFGWGQRKTAIAAVLFLVIWGVSALVWVSVPTEQVLENSYFMEITLPDNLPYPASDAAYYGLWSESILAGLGLKSSIISRQFFVWILAVIQFMRGNEIMKSIDLLTIMLELIPPMLFLLGWQLGSTGGGLMAAGIAIFREWNTLQMAPFFGVSSAKMFLSDLPMLLAFLLILSVVISWVRRMESRWRLVLAGGALAIGVLIRSQALILILPIWGCVFGSCRQSLRKKMVKSLQFTLVVLLVLSPALVRSVQLTGSAVLEDSSIHGYELARRYSNDVNWQPDPAVELGNFEQISIFIREHPMKIAQFIGNHFLKNVADSWLVLPIGTPPLFTAEDLTAPDYQHEASRLTGAPLLFWILLLMIISVGMAAAWRRNGYAGILPLAASLVYLLSSALGRYSGWRFILPADWVFYFYFSLGIFELLWMAGRGIKAPTHLKELPDSPELSPKREKPVIAVVLLIAIVIAAGFPAWSAAVIRDQIPPLQTSEMLQIARGLPAEKLPQTLYNEINSCSVEMVYGRMIYPRWFAAGDGLTSANPWPIYQRRNFDRLGFTLLNEQNVQVIIPLSASPPPLPGREEVIVIGRWSDEGWFRGELLVFPEIHDQDGVPLLLISDSL